MREWTEGAEDAARALADHGVAGLRGAFAAADCARWVAGAYAGRADWTSDFGGEQFSLGRAFYTHLEEGKSPSYFADAAASDARVERHAPGLAAAMRAVAAELTRGRVQPRRGWCGPGVHVFPARGKVARRGGVVHFDTEGLTEHQLTRRTRALSVVAMLQPPRKGGGLRVWNVAYEGEDHVKHEALRAASVTATYGVGDVVAFDSYRLHQICASSGPLDRISATAHCVRTETGWQAWF